MNSTFPKLQLGVSLCLLGEKVRFDGGHKRDKYILTFLAQHCDFTGICPEVDIGLGIPRPPIHLAGSAEAPRLVGVKDESLDYTKDMIKYSRQKVKTLNDISGFILKSNSPSCGMERVRVYHGQHHVERNGRGLFAAELMKAHPNLPVEEEGRLNDPTLRDNFIERIYAYRRWQDLVASGLTMKSLVAFHTQHKFALLAHNQAGYRRLGRLVANEEKLSIKPLSRQYITLFMTVLSKRATPKKQTNVLMHIMGFIKKQLSADDKAELLDAIERHRLGALPLIVPITLLKHYLRLYPDPYILNQTYLNPHPDELMLRNHI